FSFPIRPDQKRRRERIRLGSGSPAIESAPYGRFHMPSIKEKMIPLFDHTRNSDRDGLPTGKAVSVSDEISIPVPIPGPCDFPGIPARVETGENPARSPTVQAKILESFFPKFQRHAIERVSLSDRSEAEVRSLAKFPHSS